MIVVEASLRPAPTYTMIASNTKHHRSMIMVEASLRPAATIAMIATCLTLNKMRSIKAIGIVIILILCQSLLVCGLDVEGLFKCSGAMPDDDAGLLLHAKRLKSCLMMTLICCCMSRCSSPA